MAPMRGREPMVCTPEQAVEAVKSGYRVYVQGIAATPTLLTNALAERGKEVTNETRNCFFSFFFLLSSFVDCFGFKRSLGGGGAARL